MEINLILKLSDKIFKSNCLKNPLEINYKFSQNTRKQNFSTEIEVT